MKGYQHPEVVVHIPDAYDKAELASGKSKWKDRFSTTVRSAAQSLIQYLEWPGDARRDGWTSGGWVKREDAAELGPFAVYRLDEEATARLRTEMAKMNPARRFNPPERGRWRQGSNPEFAKELRAAIERATGL